MKIVNIIGGLGNQMFQYAFALSLQERFPSEDILIDTSHFNYLFIKKFRGANLHNGYEIEKVFPNAHMKHANWRQIARVSYYIPNYALSRLCRKLLPKRKSEYIQPLEKNFAYIPEVYQNKENLYYEGIWASVSNYAQCRSLIQKIFTHGEPDAQNGKYILEMENTDSVGIHIRRGDYLYEPAFMGICDLDYYRRGIQELLKDGTHHKFYIFSNDIEWCKANIDPLITEGEIVYVTNNVGNKSCWDMFLMSHCKDLIIANSSFSWWGAFLNNRGGRIIAPKKWTNREVEYDVWLKEWVRL